MPPNSVTLGSYLQQARSDAGLSMRQVADLADVHLTIVARLLRDDMVSPKPDHLVRLAEVLELRASDLFLLAGLPLPADQLSVDALLRSEYDLPHEAVAEVKRHIEEIVKRYQTKSTNRKEEP